MEENKKSKNIFDIATLLTIIGIFLYGLGWFYWSRYFSLFNIDVSFINISFDKIISTTWPLILSVLSGFIISLHHLYETDNDKFDIVSSIYVIVVSPFILLISNIKTNWILLLLAYFIFIIIYRVIVYFIIKKNIKIEFITKTIFTYLLSFTFVIASFIYYGYRAKKDAEKIIQNYSEDVEITLKNRNVLFGKLVTFMNENYFIICENNKCKKELIIVSKDEVSKIKMTKELL